MRALLLPACLVLSGQVAAEPNQAAAAAAPATSAKADVPAPASAANAKPDAQSVADGAAVSDRPAALDAGLRTFAGPCIIDPVGKAQEALPLLGSALAGFLPQIASAGIDALTSALDRAGQDQVVSLTAVLPIENRPRCIQVTRGVTVPSSDVMNMQDTAAGSRRLQEALRNAPFLVEFLIRSSRDGSAVSVMPTVLRYGETLDGKHHGGGARDLYATLTFSNVGSSETSQVSVPLGSYRPDPSAPPHYYDPVSEPRDPRGAYPAGAAASPWIKTPYSVETAQGTPLGVPRIAPPSADALNDGGRLAGASRAKTGASRARTAAHPAAAARVPGGNGPFGATEIPVEVGAPTPGQTLSDPTSATAPAGIMVGDEIRPITVAVTLRETRPGSAVARMISSALKGNKAALVDAADPAKERAARTADLATWKADQTGYANALGDYYKKRATYCTGSSTSQDLAGRGSDGADLLSSEIVLLAAARTAGITSLPFTGTVDPGRPNFDAVCGPAPS